MAAQDNGRVQHRHGGDHLDVYDGGQITNDGVQAAAIAAVATADADATYGQPEADLINELKTKVNSALAALRGVGIIAP